MKLFMVETVAINRYFYRVQAVDEVDALNRVDNYVKSTNTEKLANNDVIFIGKKEAYNIVAVEYY